jgi:hypothetical protein
MVVSGLPEQYPYSGAHDLKLYFNIAACGVRVRANLLMRLSRQYREIGLRHRLVLDL